MAMTKEEKAAKKAAKVAAVKAAKVEAARIKALPKVPKLTPAQVKAAAIEAKFSELKGQDAAGHKVTPAQLDELHALVFPNSGGGPGEEH